MAEIVNLRRARKAKQRDQAAQAGAEARARHGRRKADATQNAAEAARQEAVLEGHRRDSSAAIDRKADEPGRDDTP